MFCSGLACFDFWGIDLFIWVVACISGLVAEYIVAIDVTGARFPADAYVYLRTIAEGRGGLAGGAGSRE